MQDRLTETWRFTTRADRADQVYLVIDCSISPSRWIEMQPVADRPGTWQATAQITPGQHRQRYFTCEDGAFLNCGSEGLSGEPLAYSDQTDLAATA